MIRVLHVVGKMNMGGQEMFIMNLYRNIDRTKIQFDFVVHTEEKGDFEDEITAMGGRIYHIDRILKNPLKHMANIKKIVKEGQYKIIHRHTSSSLVGMDLRGAEQGGAVMRIAHSHNTQADKSNRTIHPLLMRILNKYKTHGLACSLQAGKFLFGNDDFVVVNNGIDIDKFRYNQNIRNKYRMELGIEDKLVVGHIGRFVDQKNHKFLVNIFAKLLKKEPEAVLLLIGTGELMEETRKDVQKLGITDRVMFLGKRTDVENIMQAMDVFLFPSKFEGLPVTMVEVQASGLPCVISDVISDEAVMSDCVKKLSLNDNAEKWVEALLDRDSYNRDNYKISDELMKFDIKNIAEEMTKLYLSADM